jgi:hypothetical protein
MRTRLIGLLSLLAFGALTAGCGARSLILRVDLLSFLTASETQAHYGPIPGGVSDSTTVSSTGINLLPGVQDITSVTAVTIEAAGEFANSTGSGTAQVKIYVSPEGTDPFTTDTTPIVLPVTLTPATTDTTSVTIGGDSGLASLFLADKAQLGIKVAFTSNAGPALEGDFRLITLKAIVTAKQDIVH